MFLGVSGLWLSVWLLASAQVVAADLVTNPQKKARHR